MKVYLAFIVLLGLSVLVISKSTSKHGAGKKEKEAPAKDSERIEGNHREHDAELNQRVEGGHREHDAELNQRVEGGHREHDAELNQRVEGGEGTGQSKPLVDDEAEADAAAHAAPLTPTKPPTGAKPGEIEE